MGMQQQQQYMLGMRNALGSAAHANIRRAPVGPQTGWWNDGSGGGGGPQKPWHTPGTPVHPDDRTAGGTDDEETETETATGYGEFDLDAPPASQVDPNWEQMFWEEMGNNPYASDEYWLQEKATAESQIQQQFAQQQYQLAQQMAARGMGASGQFLQGAGNIAAGQVAAQQQAMQAINAEQRKIDIQHRLTTLQYLMQYGSLQEQKAMQQEALALQKELGMMDNKIAALDAWMYLQESDDPYAWQRPAFKELYKTLYPNG